MVLGLNTENRFLKVFYKFFTSSLLKLLQKAKKKLKKNYIFRARNPKKGQKGCDELI